MNLAIGRGAGDAVGNRLCVVQANTTLHGAELVLVELKDVHNAMNRLAPDPRGDGQRQHGWVGSRLPGELPDRLGLRPQLVQPFVRHHWRQRAQSRGGYVRVLLPRLWGG